MSDKIVYLNSDNFSDEVEKYSGVVLVDFYADWCGPCRMLAPVIEQLANEYAGRAKICKINTDDAQSIAYKYQISGIPTVILFKNGKIVETIVGFRPKEHYSKILSANL